MSEIQKKKGTPPGGSWTKLETPGDVRRFLRWLILSTKNGKTDAKKAGVLGQLAIYMLKAMEDSTLEQRIRDIERLLDEEQHEAGNSVTHH